MKILVTGANGQLGYDVIRQAKKANIDVVGIDIKDLDLTDEQKVNAYFKKHHDFTAIIHCAAYTAVDKAEDDSENAKKVNVCATRYLTQAAEKMDAKIMYISTDYVYSGTKTEVLTETDETTPISVYGKTKLAGEKIVQACAKHFIVRIAWTFGKNGNNFVKTMLELSKTRNELTVVNDQFGSPTYTYDLAKLLIAMIQTEKYGTYQATNEGFCSWYEFAEKIFSFAKKDVRVIPVDSSAYPTRATRPKNSRMSKDKLVENGFFKLPHWEDALLRYLAELDDANE